MKGKEIKDKKKGNKRANRKMEKVKGKLTKGNERTKRNEAKGQRGRK